MKAKIETITFEIPDTCRLDAPTKRTLLRYLREHGPESFLASEKLNQYAACVIEELKDRGVEIVDGSENDSVADEDTNVEQGVHQQSEGERAEPATEVLDDLAAPESSVVDPPQC